MEQKKCLSQRIGQKEIVGAEVPLYRLSLPHPVLHPGGRCLTRVQVTMATAGTTYAKRMKAMLGFLNEFMDPCFCFVFVRFFLDRSQGIAIAYNMQ